MNCDIFSEHTQVLVFISIYGKDEFEGQNSLISPQLLEQHGAYNQYTDVRCTEHLPLYAMLFVSTIPPMYIDNENVYTMYTRAIIYVFSSRVVGKKQFIKDHVGKKKEILDTFSYKITYKFHITPSKSQQNSYKMGCFLKIN